MEIILNQVLIMFVIMSIGFVAFKIKFLTMLAIKQMADVVLYIATPALIINSLRLNISPTMRLNVLLTALFAFVTMVVVLLFAKFVFANDAMKQFAISFGNTGFIGIPIVQALLGGEAVVYIAMFIAVINLVVWTYGVSMIAGENADLKWQTVVMNPNNLALFIGTLLTVIPVTMPRFLSDTFEIVSQMNLPLIMIVLGCYLAESHLASLFNRVDFYSVCLLRIVAVPLLVMFLLWPISFISPVIKLVLVIAHATPGAVLLAVFSKKYQNDYNFAIGVVGVTTLLSLVSMPAIIYLSQLLFY